MSTRVIDPRLQQIAEEIQRDLQLKSFRVQSMTSRDLTGEPEELRLVDKKTAEIIVKQAVDDSNRVGLGVTPPDQGEIVLGCRVKAHPARHHALQDESERTIILLRVEPCLKN